ncbi:MAG: NADH-quinone oxidoreductase subunit M [Stenotrophomonas maltophilia]|nr:NADH-quinone oxidoreductase subunit M [Stenotrophomonas maltophilia]
MTLLGFIGLILATFARGVFRPKRWRLTPMVAHIEQTGLDAAPIVALLTFLVGAVVAFLGATVLESFGASIFTVDLVAFSFLREFGVLLTAILMAGRTASAFTAQIGSMKANEEIDAIRTMGLDPMELLVLPRVLALLVALPMLTFLAMISGIIGGGVVCAVALDISPAMFLSLLQSDIGVQHLLVGLVKAPFFAFLIAFAVKVPMFPVHTWLPDAHVEAPTAGSVILAAIALKIGGYGFLRFNLPIVPDASQEWAWLVIALSLIAVIYVGLVALVQDDMKKLIAYSSIAHMGFVTLGTFIALWLVREAGNADAARLGLQGAMVQMISHGFVSGAMFSCVGVLYDRMHSRRIADYGGVVNVMPWFATFAMLFFMANAGLPGTSGFVGEFMVILSAFQRNPWIALGAATTLIIGAAYTLWLYKRIFFGEVANSHVAELKDINGREWLVLGVFAIGVLALGIYPKPLTDLMEPSIAKLAMQIASSKLL